MERERDREMEREREGEMERERVGGGDLLWIAVAGKPKKANVQQKKKKNWFSHQLPNLWRC